jgi:hypothetical protein
LFGGAKVGAVGKLFHSVHSHSPTSLSAFPTAVSLSPIIRGMAQNFNNYIQVFREKEGIRGHQVRNYLSAMRDVSTAYY